MIPIYKHVTRKTGSGFIILSFLIIGFLPGKLFSAAAGSEQNRKPLPEMFVTSERCVACHNELITPSGEDISIGTGWASSLMAHASKDPYWQASVKRESLDHPEAKNQIEDECSACHMPMARYRAKTMGKEGDVFAHLPLLPARSRMDELAADGVSCSMCHQIQAEKLGTDASFTAGFVVDTQTPLGSRQAFGPYDIDSGRKRVMRSSARLEPNQSRHIQDSALCGSCHTLYTHTRGPDGETIGTLPEQMPFLEWRHSAYVDRQSCQSCHMPQLEDKMPITSVLGKERAAFSKHVFRGGNFFMPDIFNRYRNPLNVTARPGDLVQASRETKNHLKTSAARIGIVDAAVEKERITASVALANMAGHKLPSAYPSRRAWIHLTITDADGQVLFESGALNPDGSIVGNDNDINPRRYEPHYDRIDNPGQVQIYEAIMVDSDDKVTTGLLSAIRFIKDNRILPDGFDKQTAPEDIAVQGAAVNDANFTGMGDMIRYSAPIGDGKGPFTVETELWYQPIAFRWAKNLQQQDAAEIDRFISYYDAMSENSAVILARDKKTVRPGS